MNVFFSSDEWTKINAMFYRKIFRKSNFYEEYFHKNVHVNFYGYLDVNFVVSVFDPNTCVVLFPQTYHTWASSTLSK